MGAAGGIGACNHNEAYLGFAFEAKMHDLASLAAAIISERMADVRRCASVAHPKSATDAAVARMIPKTGLKLESSEVPFARDRPSVEVRV